MTCNPLDALICSFINVDKWGEQKKDILEKKRSRENLEESEVIP